MWTHILTWTISVYMTGRKALVFPNFFMQKLQSTDWIVHRMEAGFWHIYDEHKVLFVCSSARQIPVRFNSQFEWLLLFGLNVKWLKHCCAFVIWFKISSTHLPATAFNAIQRGQLVTQNHILLTCSLILTVISDWWRLMVLNIHFMYSMWKTEKIWDLASKDLRVAVISRFKIWLTDLVFLA